MLQLILVRSERLQARVIKLDLDLINYWNKNVEKEWPVDKAQVLPKLIGFNWIETKFVTDLGAASN